jgi:hypothetical protein
MSKAEVSQATHLLLNARSGTGTRLSRPLLVSRKSKAHILENPKWYGDMLWGAFESLEKLHLNAG